MPARERSVIKNHGARQKMQGTDKSAMKGLKEDVLTVGGMSAAIHVPLKIANVFSPLHMKMSLIMLVHCTGMMMYQKECRGVQTLLTMRDGLGPPRVDS